jgi:hypothetical protein
MSQTPHLPTLPKNLRKVLPVFAVTLPGTDAASKGPFCTAQPRSFCWRQAPAHARRQDAAQSWESNHSRNKP